MLAHRLIMVLGIFLLVVLTLLVLTSFVLAGHVLSEQNYKLLWLIIPYTAVVLFLSFLVKQSMNWPEWTMIIIDVIGFALYVIVGISVAIHYMNVWKMKRKLNRLDKA